MANLMQHLHFVVHLIIYAQTTSYIGAADTNRCLHDFDNVFNQSADSGTYFPKKRSFLWKL